MKICRIFHAQQSKVCRLYHAQQIVIHILATNTYPAHVPGTSLTSSNAPRMYHQPAALNDTWRFHYSPRLPSTVHEMYDKTPIAALMLLSRLKIKYPPFIGNGPYPGQGLFLTALMMATKAMRTKFVETQSWSTIGQEFFNVQELLTYERGMLKILGEDVRIDGKQLEDFERLLYHDYGMNRSTYPKMYPASVFSGNSHATGMHGSGSAQNPFSNHPVQRAVDPREPRFINNQDSVQASASSMLSNRGIAIIRNLRERVLNLQ
ncbi:hypothetical protein BDQ17DRAFT_1541556 [Cyathus striatus]|nr:hypothetical protein BDQ17DRAFT_1541556 [Cyathus striatus]